MKFSLIGTTMVVAAAIGVALPTTDSSSSLADLALAVLEGRISTNSSSSPTHLAPAHLASGVLESQVHTKCGKIATDKLAFRGSISTFLGAREARNPTMCVWAERQCDWHLVNPKYNFTPSCERHNFAYRNTKMQKRFTKAMKERIDDMLEKDLHEACAQFSSADDSKECRKLANIYVSIIRQWNLPVKHPLAGLSDAQKFKKLSEVVVVDIEVDHEQKNQVIPQIDEHLQDVAADGLDTWFGPLQK